MGLPSYVLVSVGGRRSQRLGPSPTLKSLGPFHQRRHKFQVSLEGSPCAHGILSIPCGELRYIFVVFCVMHLLYNFFHIN